MQFIEADFKFAKRRIRFKKPVHPDNVVKLHWTKILLVVVSFLGNAVIPKARDYYFYNCLHY